MTASIMASTHGTGRRAQNQSIADIKAHVGPRYVGKASYVYLEINILYPVIQGVTTGKMRRDPSSTSSLPQFLASTPRRVTTTTTRTHQHHNADSGWRGDALAHGDSNFVSMAEEAWAATLKEVEKAISTRSTATAGGGREGERESWCG